MKIEFTKDFAGNWKAGEIVEARYLSTGEILVDNVASVDAKQLLEHCKIVSESETKNE